MKSRMKVLIALFSALVLLVVVTLGCFGYEDGEKGFVIGGYLQK